jgi:hypothetical protein
MKAKELPTINDLTKEDDLTAIKLAMMPFFICGATLEPEKAFKLFDKWEMVEVKDIKNSTLQYCICPDGMKEFIESLFNPETGDIKISEDFLQENLRESVELSLFTEGLGYINNRHAQKKSIPDYNFLTYYEVNVLSRLLRKHSAWFTLYLINFSPRKVRCPHCGENTLTVNKKLEKCDVPLQFLMGKHIFAQNSENRILI